jgi:hypothetical protein
MFRKAFSLPTCQIEGRELPPSVTPLVSTLCKECNLPYTSNAAAIEVPVEVAVEVVDAVPRWSYGMLAANFARVQILVAWYGGDPDRYLDAIANGIEDFGDRGFLCQIKERLRIEPLLLDDMRRIVGEFARRFPSA